MGAFELNDTRSDVRSDMSIRAAEPSSESFYDNQATHGTHGTHERSSTCISPNECKNKPSGCDCGTNMPNPRCIKEENIIALKIYDSCRHQYCNNILLRFILKVKFYLKKSLSKKSMSTMSK